MNVFSFLLAAILGLGGATPAPETPSPRARGNDRAREILAHSSGQLFRITLTGAQPQVQLIGSFGAEITDLAQTGDGRVYGVSFSSLYLIDLQSGQAMLVGSLGISSVNGLTATGQNRLLASSTDGRLFSVDPRSGRATQIGGLGQGVVSSGDLCVGPGGVLYMTAPLGARHGNVDLLMRVDPSTGVATQVGRTGVNRVYGLALAGEELIGLTEGGAVVRLDQQTGAATPLGQTTVRFWGGA